MKKATRLYFGPKARVYLLTLENGKSEVADMLNQLDKRTKNKLDKLMHTFCEMGEVQNKEKFRFEGDGLFTFKIDNLRLLGFFLPNAPLKSQLIIHSFVKKTQRAPKRELQKALSIKQEIEEQGYEFSE